MLRDLQGHAIGQAPDRALEPIVGERLQTSAAVAHQMMVMMAGAAPEGLVAEHALSGLDTLDETHLIQLLHHAVHAGSGYPLPPAPERLLYLAGRQGTGLRVEQLENRLARAAAAMPGRQQSVRGTLRPARALRSRAHRQIVGAAPQARVRERRADERGACMQAQWPVAACRARISLSSSATCHCSKLSDCGESVSVTVATGMPRSCAISFTRCTSGLTFWLLYTHTAI